MTDFNWLLGEKNYIQSTRDMAQAPNTHIFRGLIAMLATTGLHGLTLNDHFSFLQLCPHYMTCVLQITLDTSTAGRVLLAGRNNI